MADFSTIEGIAAFTAEKTAQLEAAMLTNLPGLQTMATSRVFSLVRSTDDFYEMVTIGQIPRDEIERYKTPEGQRGYRPMVEGRKQLKNRAIDLTDAEVLQILDGWAEGKTAFALPFVYSVWDRAGAERKKLP